MLKLVNVKKHFGGIKAVDGCSFEVEENKITALIGPNGSGKTTMFNLITGVHNVDSGKVYFGEDITNFPIYKRASLISRQFQQSRIFENITVDQNLMLAVNDSGLKSLFSKFEVPEDIYDFMHIRNIRHKRGDELSYGQRKLVEIARSFLKEHKLLMLDEPVAGVSPKIRNEIRDMLLAMKKKGETILFIEHDMNFTLSIADRVIVMDEGKIIADGSPEQIRKNKRVIEAYLG